MALNNIVLQGRLTDDIAVRFVGDACVTNYTVAVDRDFKDKATGEKATDFISCVSWRQQADYLHTYARKGDKVTVCGRLQGRDWVDKDGGKHRSFEVISSSVYVDSRNRSTDQSTMSTGVTAPEFVPVPDDGELPF